MGGGLGLGPVAPNPNCNSIPGRTRYLPGYTSQYNQGYVVFLIASNEWGSKMENWLIEHWLAILALLVAFVGGLPGVLKVIEHFRPISLTGSIKFFAPTKSVDPPEGGILLAVTLVNQGSKNLVWRKLAGTLSVGGKKIALVPKLIPNTLLLQGRLPQPDLMNQQSILPGTPVNAYLLLTETSGRLTGVPISPSKLCLRFELESGGRVVLGMPFVGQHVVQKGETYPSHSIECK